MQPLADCAAVQAHKVVHADLDQPLAPDQVQAGYLAVFIIKAAAVDQRLDSSGVEVRERDDSAAGLIRPPSVRADRQRKSAGIQRLPLQRQTAR